MSKILYPFSTNLFISLLINIFIFTDHSISIYLSRSQQYPKIKMLRLTLFLQNYLLLEALKIVNLLIFFYSNHIITI